MSEECFERNHKKICECNREALETEKEDEYFKYFNGITRALMIAIILSNDFSIMSSLLIAFLVTNNI